MVNQEIPISEEHFLDNPDNEDLGNFDELLEKPASQESTHHVSWVDDMDQDTYVRHIASGNGCSLSDVKPVHEQISPELFRDFQ